MGAVILIFQENLRVIIQPTLTPIFEVGNERFIAIENNEFNGFYNLLRTDESTILGVLYYPFEPDVCRTFAEFDYVSNHTSGDGNCELTIYFGNAKDNVAELMVIQEWGRNYIYRSEAGALAISFGVPLENFELATCGHPV